MHPTSEARPMSSELKACSRPRRLNGNASKSQRKRSACFAAPKSPQKLLAWMHEKPAASAAIGEGELAGGFLRARLSIPRVRVGADPQSKKNRTPTSPPEKAARRRLGRARIALSGVGCGEFSEANLLKLRDNSKQPTCSVKTINSLAVEAVIGELVSDSYFPVSRENTGKFCHS